MIVKDLQNVAQNNSLRQQRQSVLANIGQQVTGLGYVASATESEIVFRCPSIEAARELDRRIYDGSLTIQKTPLAGSGGMWEVRVSDG